MDGELCLMGMYIQSICQRVEQPTRQEQSVMFLAGDEWTVIFLTLLCSFIIMKAKP